MNKILNILCFSTALIFLMGGIVSCGDDDDENDQELDQIAFDDADVVNGGRLYDKFWADETDFTSPSDPSVSLANITGFGDFYRCKGCHAWDQKGNLASYIDRGPETDRPNVSGVNLAAIVPSMSIRELFDEIAHDGGAAVDPARTADGTNSSLGGDMMPDFGKILSESQMWDIVKFLKEGTLDTEQLYDIQTTGTYPSGERDFVNVGKNGDVVAGDVFYQANCASCHGTNGRDDGDGNVIAINVEIGRSMGQFAREKPYEMQHKARYGNLGSTPQMPGVADATLDDIKNMFKALADTEAFPDL